MKLYRLLLIGMLTLPMSFASYAQNNPGDDEFKFNTWSLSGGFGMTEFYGDVSRAVFYPGSVKDNTFPYTIFFSGKKYLSPYLGASLDLGFGIINSQWTDDPRLAAFKEPFWFEAEFLDYSLNAEINLTNLFWPKMYNKRISAYTLIGMGNTHYRTVLRDSADVFMNSIGYSSNGMVKEKRRAEAYINTGAGIKYRITNRWAVGLEGVIKHLPSDKLDAWDRGSYRLSELDKYGYTGIEIEYNFGKSNEFVPLEFNPTPKEDLLVKKELERLNKRIDSINDIIANDIDPKLDDLVNWKEKEMPDDDGDNVPNYKDLEPNTKPGAQTDTHGRTINIPTATATYSVNPDKLLQWQSVYFALDKTFLTRSSYERIANVAAVMNDNPDIKVEIVGNACRIASDSYNMDLSKRRAERVQKSLIEDFKINPSRLSITYYGESRPISTEIIYLNRRVDFRVGK